MDGRAEAITIFPSLFFKKRGDINLEKNHHFCILNVFIIILCGFG